MAETIEQHNIRCRGIRGATAVAEDTREHIHAAARELIDALVEANDLQTDDIASVLFTTTPDLRAAFPAEAARHISPDWEYVPLMGAVEMDKQDAIARCIRVLIHWNTSKSQREIIHLYLRGTEALRRPTTDDRRP